MSEVFPDGFDLRKLHGPRARQFDSREDAFQQLVGDGLLAMAGHLASVAPTKGQDGSIDAFVEAGCQLTGPFKDVAQPLILECKDHDDTLGRVGENIFGAWQKVANKLLKHAQAGWPGLFSPWKRAAGYAYCVSASVPNKETKDELERRICAFFASLPEEYRPPIRSIRVIGWADLRPWLGTLLQVADAWLGVGLPGILDHQSHLARLSGFRRFLLNSELPFVPPADTDPWHPRQLLQTIEKAKGKPGIMLVGAGGVGKTRISLELATLAASEGWRVLNVQPGQPEVTTDDLAEIILPQITPTLLVFDYLDQMQHLDLGTIRRRLLPEAIQRGIRIALLANSRPGWMRVPIAERDELFAQVPIRPEVSQNRRIVQAIAETAAPTACYSVGREAVISICGNRPTIGLLIARELERRARDGSLQAADVQNLRTGDLAHWLRRRLAEPPLCVRQDQMLLSRPAVPVVAVAAVLACAPHPRDTLVLTAQASLTSLGWDRPEDADRLVDLLVELGWLEQEHSWLGTAHDVVADEVVDQVIRDGTSVRERELEALLAVTQHVAHSLGRFAVALRRVLGSIELDEAVNRVHQACVSWMRRKALSLGQSLSGDDPDATAYALGAVLGGPPWNDLAVELWDMLVGPWLSEHGNKEEARHLLYRGLRVTDLNCSPMLLAAALDWLGSNVGSPTGSFVLGPLLGRTDLGEKEAEAGTAHALTSLAKHGKSPDADFVFNRLLRKRNLSDSTWQVVANLALCWLDRMPDDQPGRDHALYSILTRPAQLPPEHREKIARHSLNWLRSHSADKSADRMPAALQRLRCALPKDHALAMEIGRVVKALGVPEQPDHGYFKSLVTSLNEAARKPSESVDIALVEEGCIEVCSRAQASPSSAGYAVAPLLVLGCRFGGRALDEVTNAVTAILGDERLTDSQRKRIAGACLRFLDANAFPSREKATDLLRKLRLYN